MDANRARAVDRYSAGDARRADEMDGGQYIRLRYSMQFTSGGRAHTIEMEVSVPVGANAEQREQLIREAEANMELLYRRVEARARGQRPSDAAQRGTSPQPAQSTSAPSPAHTSPSADQRPPQSVPATSVATSITPEASTAHEGPQAISFSDRRAVASPTASAGSSAARPAQTPQARSSTSPELPVVPGMASMGSGTMKLSEFIQIVRDNWGLAPKEAMDLLQVKSLNNMNYRDLLRQLETLVAQRASGVANTTSTTHQPAPASSSSSAAQSATPQREQAQSLRPAASLAKAQQPSAAAKRSPDPLPGRPSSPSSPQLAGPTNIPVYPLREHTIREPGRVYKFDEEEEEEEQEEREVGVDVTAEEGSMSEAMARIKIDELRDMRGTVAANQGRLKVLHNLLDSQISDEQFLQLIERLWHLTSDKNLKQDQVEALISWSKEDYFEDEVRAVLAVLNEQA